MNFIWNVTVSFFSLLSFTLSYFEKKGWLYRSDREMNEQASKQAIKQLSRQAGKRRQHTISGIALHTHTHTLARLLLSSVSQSHFTAAVSFFIHFGVFFRVEADQTHSAPSFISFTSIHFTSLAPSSSWRYHSCSFFLLHFSSKFLPHAYTHSTHTHALSLTGGSGAGVGCFLLIENCFTLHNTKLNPFKAN